MKNLLVVFGLLISVLTSNVLKAQSQWDFQTNPLPAGPILGKVQFVSDAEGWISVSDGSLLHTVNGGSIWNTVTPFPDDTVSTISDPAFSMCWINHTYGWIMTSRGTGFEDADGAIVQKTMDGGKTWTKKELPRTAPASGSDEDSDYSGDVGAQIQFVDENNGWASTFNIYTQKGQLYKSTDGGNNWTLVNTLPTTDEAIYLHFADPSNGWMVSINDEPALFEILKTSDGGTTWVSQFSDTTPNADTLSSSGAIQFTDANNGWAVGPNGRVLKTVNGGANWNLLNNTGIGTNANSKCLFFLNANTGWIATNISGNHQDPTQRVILHTKDGGVSWTRQDITSTDAIFSLYFRDAVNGWFTADKCVQNCNLSDSLKVFSGVIGHTGYPTKQASIQSNDEINIYPNPTNNTLFVKGISPNSSVSIIDLNGQSLTNGQLMNHQIDISQLMNGVYFLQIVDGERKLMRRFIKQ